MNRLKEAVNQAGTNPVIDPELRRLLIGLEFGLDLLQSPVVVEILRPICKPEDMTQLEEDCEGIRRDIAYVREIGDVKLIPEDRLEDMKARSAKARLLYQRLCASLEEEMRRMDQARANN
jgi:hypothetical protein